MAERETPPDDDAPDWHEERAARADEKQARQEERDRYREESTL